ncbi:transcription initiation factor TFIID subunit 4 [Pimephales promelas]|uniref:transcription initiation factor TFIID subunit 4 n=1 Tax=Pimephales promelas TaxID=90988 RepID=UPI001955CB85|nr:transcription initiation factor TFIID subunit 4 [Pimephales promelas]KAG1964557.1 transcription initiation factor TFIID subunit [Pimephales promelas]
MSETAGSDKLDNDQSRAPTEKRESNIDAQTSNTEESLETALDKKRLKDFDSNANVNTSENNNPDSASHNEEGDLKTKTDSSNSASQRFVTVAVNASAPASSVPAPKIIAGPTQIRSTTPVVVGARVVTSSVQGPGATSLALVSQPGRVSVSSMTISQPRVITTLTTAKGPVVTLPRISTPSKSVPMTRTPQTVPLQLPANFQVPQGMVLIRSDSGQLMLVSQQALAQAQAQGMLPKPASANASATVRPPSSQATVTTTPIIRVSLPPASGTATTNIKLNPTPGTAVQKPPTATGTAIFTPSCTTGTTIIKPAVVIGTAVRKPSSTMGPVIKASQMTPNSSTSGSFNQRTNSVTATTVINTTAVKSVSKGALSTQGNAPCMVSPNVPTRSCTNTSSTPVTVTAETLENVKKCKNFLVTLMKLASSGTRSADMAQNVRALVKGLLDGKLEAEEFTEKLYMELKSSPQPYLVPFLKRSLPAVRQLTPNSQLFIQQYAQLKPSDSASSKATNQKPTASISSSLKPNQPTRTAHLVIQQPKGLIVKPTLTSAQVGLPAQKQTQPKHMVLETKTCTTGAVVRQSILQASKTHFSQSSLPAQAHGFKDSTSGSFRDDDDINDVASMAGVNLSEESARILASGSELVGSVIRSCQEEPFLFPSALQTRVLHIGGSLSIKDVCPDVLELLSLATQERLRDLLEKLTVVAQHRQISYKDDWRYSQTNDVRSQLKFLEQLERLEKQRREEEEREALLRIARSRSNSEDPEQQRLKQRAKEMQQLELAQMEHRDANLAALAALGPRKRKPLEAPGSGANQLLGSYGQFPTRAPIRVTMRDLTFCMEQDPTFRHTLMLYKAFLG